MQKPAYPYVKRALVLLTIVSAMIVVTASLTPSPQHAAADSFTLDQIKSYPFPNELTTSATGSRIAWAFNERGARNVWVAEGPDFKARRLTNYDHGRRAGVDESFDLSRRQVCRLRSRRRSRFKLRQFGCSQSDIVASSSESSDLERSFCRR